MIDKEFLKKLNEVVKKHANNNEVFEQILLESSEGVVCPKYNPEKVEELMSLCGEAVKKIKITDELTQDRVEIQKELKKRDKKFVLWSGRYSKRLHIQF